MFSIDFKDRRTYLVIGLVLLFSLFALWIRLLPAMVTRTDILSAVAGDDPMYNLRQVEQILANYPAYSWFDPMTLFPTGTQIYWGPLFTVLSATVCLVTGATTRPEIIGTCLLIPPVMAAIVVAMMYWVGKTCGDWKTGLLASGLTAVVTGQFFFRSSYGYFDHHIGEVLFSTLFCLFYMAAVQSEKDAGIDLAVFASYKKTLFLALIAGIAYLLGLFLMPTMILFAMIVGIFTLIQFVIDVMKGRTSEYLLVLNGGIFAVAIAGLLLFGFKAPGLELSEYSLGHVYAYLLLIAGTGFLYLVARQLKGKPAWYFPAIVAGTAIAFTVILAVASPETFNRLIVDLFAFFGQEAVTNTVQEAMGWTASGAWLTFNYGVLLFIGGAIIMVYNNIRDEHPHQVFALVWSFIVLFSTVQHVRYEYYLAVNIALLSAVCIAFPIGGGWKVIRGLLQSPGETEKPGKKGRDDQPRGKKKKVHEKAAPGISGDAVMALLLIVVVVVGALFAYTSASESYSAATSDPFHLNDDWKESLQWMGNNTPDPGVGYLTIYNPATFQYPPQAYGVMSWWDYGHMITFIAKRIPNANPFQQGVAGPNGSASFFVTTSEDSADAVLDHDGTRYIVTDIEMDTSKFYAMTTWYNATLQNAPYQQTFATATASNPNALQPVTLDTQQYYLTMVSRLHNFDGSMTDPSTAYYIEYEDPALAQVSVPVITNAQSMNATDAEKMAAAYNQNATAGHHAIVLNPAALITSPIETVPALHHYRLVHESPTNVFGKETPDVKYVKVFEYVKGAHIRGDGIIDLSVTTNTGRNFTYRQQSVNGEFVVPYSTTGNTYGVVATGKYQIEGTNKQYDVPEAAVEQGLTVG